MHEIKEKVPEKTHYFLTTFEKYVDKKFIYFGSVQRIDFIQKYSDIDIAIISDNVEETITRLKNFLQIDNRKIRKIFQKMPNNNTIIYGYKTNFDDIDNNLSIEIMIYDEKYTDIVYENIKKTNNLPFYITYSLLLLKIFHYYLHIISHETLKFIKKQIMNTYLHQNLNDNLIAIKQ